MKVQNLLTLAATSALITSASASITMDWVNVGNAGNAADPTTGFGAVSHDYKIGNDSFPMTVSQANNQWS